MRCRSILLEAKEAKISEAMVYDLAILGGGPAAAAAGVYAARKKLKTALIAKEFGGQSVVSPDIQNWIGAISITGIGLGEAFKKHLEAYASDTLEIHASETIRGVTKNEDGLFAVTTDKGIYGSRAVLVATGASRRRLEVPGAERFENKGLTYCATCDGPLFAEQHVAVIGGGNAGFETAAQLLAYAQSVTLLHRSREFKADPVTVEKVLAHPHMKAMKGVETQEIFGDQFVKGLRYKDTASGETKELSVTGIFVEIGLLPNTDFLGDLAERDEYKRIKIDPWTQRTTLPGIWAAGDSTNGRFHQNNIAAGDAVKALEDIYLWVRTGR